MQLLTSVREERIWSLGRALASKGGVKTAKREIVVEVGKETEMGLNWGLKKDGLDGELEAEGEAGRESLAVAEE